MATIPEMIRSGKYRYSSASLLREGVKKSGVISFSEDRLAAADRIETLEAQISILKEILHDKYMSNMMGNHEIREVLVGSEYEIQEDD